MLVLISPQRWNATDALPVRAASCNTTVCCMQISSCRHPPYKYMSGFDTPARPKPRARTLHIPNLITNRLVVGLEPLRSLTGGDYPPSENGGCVRERRRDGEAFRSLRAKDRRSWARLSTSASSAPFRAEAFSTSWDAAAPPKRMTPPPSAPCRHRLLINRRNFPDAPPIPRAMDGPTRRQGC